MSRTSPASREKASITPGSGEGPVAVWSRRDLRLQDHPAWAAASRTGSPLLSVFVVDARNLEEFAGAKPRAAFFGALLSYADELKANGGEMLFLDGEPSRVLPAALKAHGIRTLYLHEDYEPAGRRRDESVAAACERSNIKVVVLVDHVLTHPSAVTTLSGTPFRKFTPYKNAANKILRAMSRDESTKPGTGGAEPGPGLKAGAKFVALDPKFRAESKITRAHLEKYVAAAEAASSAVGVDPRPRSYAHPMTRAAALARLRKFCREVLADYERTRNLPALEGTSRISADLRSGLISVREVWAAVGAATEHGASRTAIDVFRGELLWRDFFISIGCNYPRVFDGPFNDRFGEIRWRNDPREFKAWCEGRTGYPIVDAGIRELVATGFMHNRVRMITAMFLVKDLLVDWRWGERFFREHLIDGDLAVNNGNWQWCASTGSDSQPYFRIFNPTAQGQKWDPDGEYVRRWIPELSEAIDRAKLKPRQIRIALHQPDRVVSELYIAPIVDHASARMRCLLAFRDKPAR